MRGTALLISCVFVAGAACAETADTPSGLPVPRFASVKYERGNCRQGPSFEHPVKLVYVRQGLPVLIVAESVDHWRKIEDADGQTCWMHRSGLRAASHALVLEQTALRSAPSEKAKARATLAAGVLARIEKRKPDGWCKLKAAEFRGWAPADALFGVEIPQDRIASHN
jgi:SH3-like domain-containing protein